MSWDPEQYLKFADARRRPADDLLARLDGVAASSVVDLGCGAGNITRLLAVRWPQARIVGVDNDPAMLEKAAMNAGNAGNAETAAITWRRAEIATWRASPAPDLIFSNAALHWLDDHPRLFPALIGQLADDGVLAVQMPANFAAPSHRLLRELADEPPWHEELRGARMGSVLSAEDYHRLLSPHCRFLELWETRYWQWLAGEDAVFEWMKGTTLRPYLERLDSSVSEDFLAIYRQRLRAAYPRQAGGGTRFPFKRLFFVARR